MNRISPRSAWKSLALAAAAAMSLTACMTAQEEAGASADNDGQAAYITSEVDQMGQVYGQLEGGLAKGSALDVTITGELVIEPFAYDSSCGCFIRHAVFTGIQGYERDRLDSVTLYDSAGAKLDKWRPAKIATIVHTRNVTKAKDGRQADIRIDVTAEFKTENGTRKGVWNGTMTGSYNGSEFKSGTVTDVVRSWDNRRFGFPESGTIEIDRPVLHFLAEFLGDSKAKVTIKNKVNGTIRILYVDADYHETEPKP